MYAALSHSPDKFEGHTVRRDVYRTPSRPRDGVFEFESDFTGYVPNEDGNLVETNVFYVGYTQHGDRGPIVLLLHGVPTNRRAKFHIQELLAPFCRTISIDMLGMGGEETSMPIYYGFNQGLGVHNGKPDDPSAWDWEHDTHYIHQLMTSLYPNEKWFFQADDWGGGILSSYIDIYPEDLLGAIWVDPIAFDGYPVSEIQAFGRAAMIPRGGITKHADGTISIDDSKFETLMGAADQTLVQILKTMVYDPNKYNQYVLRDLKKAYIDVDYERSYYKSGEDANSLTLKLKFHNIRVLTERAAVLSPTLLLPEDPIKNPRGVHYENWKGPSLILWGGQDNMMPAGQMWRFKNVLVNSPTQVVTIDNSGHFVEIDSPERVAEYMLDFISRIVGVSNLGDVFLGYRTIWKGDERKMIRDLRKIHGIRK